MKNILKAFLVRVWRSFSTNLICPLSWLIVVDRASFIHPADMLGNGAHGDRWKGEVDRVGADRDIWNFTVFNWMGLKGRREVEGGKGLKSDILWSWGQKRSNSVGSENGRGGRKDNNFIFGCFNNFCRQEEATQNDAWKIPFTSYPAGFGWLSCNASQQNWTTLGSF